MAKEIKGIVVNDEQCQIDITSIVGTVTSPNGTKYVLKVDDKGNLYADDGAESGAGAASASTDADVVKLYINSFYCGGKSSDEHTINYCSHNFVELSNLTDKDIKLDNVTLQYAISNVDWSVLHLKGVIKSGSTFLIRGAQCSLPNSPTTKIHVDNYDMEWVEPNGELIKFDDTSAKFYLSLNQEAYSEANPYNESNSTILDVGNYIDLVGIKTTIDANVHDPAGYEGKNTPYEVKGKINNKLFRKYYAMDPVSQATKQISARKNSNDWCYIDLTREDGEVIPCITDYTPRASYENKDIFYNKTKLKKDKPSMITCSFGIQATDKQDGNGATRCFNWVSSNLENKYIWIRPSGQTSWAPYINESFYENDGRSEYTFKYYNRDIKEYTGGIAIVVNKFIKSGFTAGTYEYLAGSKNENNEPIFEKCTEIRTFKVRTNAEIEQTGIKFVQTSDQQGFNWEEYQMWKYTTDIIAKENISNDAQFMINTGDMTQNGNRISEWLDYFDAKGSFFKNMEEMATIGNNDLSMTPLYLMGNGSDGSKIWHENFEIFYTFEADTNNLPVAVVNEKEYFIPSLYSFNYGNTHFVCLNSEIKQITETQGYKFSTFGNFYPRIKEWCEEDIRINSGYTWNIMMCHEMPFTIQTAEVVNARMDAETHAEGWKMVSPNRITNGKGCSACINISDDKIYWVTEFCQTHNFKLVIGGHKHTQATTYPLMENIKYEDSVRTVDSYHPIIVVDSATTLVEYKGYKYPNDWFNVTEVSGDTVYTPKDDATKRKIGFCTFEYIDNIEQGLTPVVYAMSQATGYKHTSNKELPSPDIAWLQYYFPATVDWTKESSISAPTVNAQQKFPFYTIWNINNSQIVGNIRKAWGIFNSKGKFDINIEGEKVKHGGNAVDASAAQIHSINGAKTDATSDFISLEPNIVINK